MYGFAGGHLLVKEAGAQLAALTSKSPPADPYMYEQVDCMSNSIAVPMQQAAYTDSGLCTTCWAWTHVFKCGGMFN